MHSIRRFFVSAKHWQLFLIVCGVFALGWGIMSIGGSGSSEHESLVRFWLPAIALNVALGLYVILWTWSYATFLTSVTPAEIRLNLRLLRVAMVFPFIFLPLSSVVPLSMTEWLAPFYFCLMFCMVYVAYFMSKGLVQAETRNRAELSDYVVLFFLFSFYFIGIWAIQPRINRLFAAMNAPGEAVEN